MTDYSIVVREYLCAQLRSDEQQETLTSVSVVIRRLITDGLNLVDAWHELFEKCPLGSQSPDMIIDKWQLVINTIVDAAAGWSLENLKNTRQAIRDVTDLTGDIQKKADELAKLLRQRDRICEEYRITKEPLDFHPLELFKSATKLTDNSRTYYLFMGRVDERLRQLRGQFDLKYWPLTADVVEAIARAQDGSTFQADPLSEVAFESRQASIRDFMRVLDQALSELSTYCSIEISFTNKNYASIVNAACGLTQTADDAIDEALVKKYRADKRRCSQ